MSSTAWLQYDKNDKTRNVNKQCLLDTPAQKPKRNGRTTIKQYTPHPA